MKRWLKNKKIGVLYGGQSAEREISLLTGCAVISSLKASGCRVEGIDVTPALPSLLLQKKIDFAFIALHGPWGEDGTVQGLLEIMDIPYTGCGVLSSALCMNKIYTKRIFDSAGIPTPAWTFAKKGSELRPLRLPAVVKPATQGSAIGVAVVKNAAELRAAVKKAFTLDTEVLAEEYVPGTEITIGVLGDKVLPVIEIVPAGAFYDFKSKYQPGQSRHLIPPRLPANVIKKTQRLAREVFDAAGCRAVARIDMIVDKQNLPRVLEVNTIPGMTVTSLLPDAARAAGISFDELVLKIIEYSL